MNSNWIIIGMIFIPINFAHAQVSPDAIVKSQDTANSISSTVKSKTSNASKLNDSHIRPISGDKNMNTYDGETSFDGKAVCKGTSEFMRMLVQPTVNGDLKIINIMQDTTMAGKLNINTAPGWDVSVVCSNGFQTCSDPNKASTCKSWGWVADNKTYQLGRESVAMRDLGGCYCISNKCGNNLAWNNITQILNDLGGGASQALSKVNPWFVLSKIKVDGVSASFVGGETASCSFGDVNGFYGTDDGKKIITYTNNMNAMSSDADTEKQKSQAYKMITTGSLNPNESAELRSCTVTRNIGIDEPKIDEIITFDGGEGDVKQCGPDCIDITLGKRGDNYWHGQCSYYEISSNFFIKDYTRIKSATLVSTNFDDWMQLWAGNDVIWNGPYGNWNDSGPVPGPCELNTIWSMQPNMNFTPNLQKNGQVKFKIRVEVTGNGQGYAQVRINTDMTCRQADEYTSDTCKAYETDNDCQLVDETVDGVKTFSGGISTGLIPLVQTQVIHGNFCSVEAKRDWFKKNRVYRCNKKTDFNFDKIIERKSYIDQNVTSENYKDKIFNSDGSTSFSGGDLFWPEMPKVDSCINMCKTRKARTTPSMSLSGQVDQNNKDNVVKYDNFYYECGSENLCPAEKGEEIIKACQCLNEFAEASAIMQVIRQAGQDLICTSGSPKQPGTKIQ